MSPGDRLSEVVPDAIRGHYLAKFAVGLLVVALLTGAIGLYTAEQTRAELEGQVHHELETVARLQADEINQWYEERRHTVRMLSNDAVMRTDDRERLDIVLDAKLRSLPDEAASMHVVETRSATVVESTDDDRVGERLDAPWVGRTTEFETSAGVFVSSPYRTRGRPTLAFVSPVVNQPNRTVVVEVNASVVAQRLRSPYEGSFTQVVNADGTVVFAQQDGRILEQYAEGESMAVKQGIDGEYGVMDMDAMAGVIDEKHVMAYVPVSGADWVVLVHAPNRVAYSIVSNVQTNIAFLVVAVVLCLGGVGATIGRNTVKALQSVTDDAAAIAEGRLDATPERSGRIDEIGRLRDSFDEMLSYLNTVAGQAEALADGEFDADVLDEEVPGEFGATLSRMHDDLRRLVTETEQAKAEAEQAREDAERARREAEALNESLEATAAEFGQVMGAAAAGDLTRRMDADADSEAMARVAEEFNATMDALQETLVRIREFADAVDDSSERVVENAEEVERASHEVSESVRDISSAADEQTDSLDEVAGEMNDLSVTVEEIASSSSQVAATSQRAAEVGERGSDHAATALEEMDAIERTADATVEEVERLNREVSEIGEIVEVIDDIAEQTNLLALNANIEAARAGEAGDGFGVVADEVKTLAEETAAATEDIEAIVEDVQSATAETVEDMREMSQRVSDGAETVESALTALEEVGEHVEEVDAGVQSINDATDEQAASTEEAVAMVDEVASTSEETAAEAETVATAAEQQTTAIAEITESAHRLSDRSDELSDVLAEFDLDAGASATAEDEPSGGEDDEPPETEDGESSATEGDGSAGRPAGADADGTPEQRADGGTTAERRADGGTAAESRADGRQFGE